MTIRSQLGSALLLLLFLGIGRAERPPAIAREAPEDLARVERLPIPETPVLAPDVKDPVFSFMVGLLDRNLYGAVERAHFERAIEVAGRSSRIPCEFIRLVRRAPGRRGFNWVSTSFTEALKVPVPYSILGYHPGSLLSSQDLLFAEWHMAGTHVNNPLATGPPYFELLDVALWGVVEGELRMDIDRWLDFMLGGKLDDTEIIGLALFRFRGVRYALALGFNDEGRGRSGALDLVKDEILYPNAKELKVIARDLRGRIIARLAKRGVIAWRPPTRRHP